MPVSDRYWAYYRLVRFDKSWAWRVYFGLDYCGG